MYPAHKKRALFIIVYFGILARLYSLGFQPEVYGCYEKCVDTTNQTMGIIELWH
jgi:hypothetical protein